MAMTSSNSPSYSLTHGVSAETGLTESTFSAAWKTSSMTHAEDRILNLVLDRLDASLDTAISRHMSAQTAALVKRQDEVALSAAKAVVVEQTLKALRSNSGGSGSRPPPGIKQFGPLHGSHQVQASTVPAAAYGSSTSSAKDLPERKSRSEQLHIIQQKLNKMHLPQQPTTTTREQAQAYVRSQMVEHGASRNVFERIMGAHMEDRVPRTTPSGTRRNSLPTGYRSPVKKVASAGSCEEVGRLEWLVTHPFFDWACAFIIIVHSIVVGMLVNADAGELSPLGVLNHLFNLFFVLELILRLAVFRCQYFSDESWNWNLFDMFLVLQYVLDTLVYIFIEDAVDTTSSYSWKGLRILRMLRVVRIIRVLRFCKELGFMAMSIMDSLKSLLWAIILLAIIMYVFAVAFTQSTNEHFKTLDVASWDSSSIETLEERFASLPKAFYTLMLSVTNGMAWVEVCNGLMDIDALMPALFLFYIAFTILALLNIITGIFVDSAVQTTKMQSDFVMQKELELRERYVADMQDIFAEFDLDGNGLISLEEFMSIYAIPEIRSYFWALGMHSKDAQRLFKLLDIDGSGEVSMHEFLDGCLRLKGEARSIDLHQLLVEVKKQSGIIRDLYFHAFNEQPSSPLSPLQGQNQAFANLTPTRRSPHVTAADMHSAHASSGGSADCVSNSPANASLGMKDTNVAVGSGAAKRMLL